ncbi:MFS transporter [Nitratireductor sp. CAU 1489]|uniref:MFS transporter n=1 Tax=Nitratireductor arenosus TaxID=2682096 RepID=A0A844QGJ0_9HYPH|nr:MFS transporter [Nitratireductor arenosus]MVA99076.1 MFS transporter [Nitratireductor arenosus]
MATSATDTANQPDGRQSWYRLALCMVLGTIGSVGMWAIVVVLPAAQIEFGVNRADASIPYTATMVGFALGNVVIGRFVDRMGVAIPIAAAVVMLGSGFLLGAVASSVWLLAAAQVLAGFGAAATFGPMMADISRWFVRRRGIAVAAAASGNYIAGAIWPFFLQTGMEYDGWRFTYSAVGLFCLATMLPLTLLLRGRAPEFRPGNTLSAPPQRRAAGLSPRALQGLLIVAGLGCCVAMSMPQVHIVAYCVDLGFGLARGAEMLSLMLAAGIVSRLASGVIADRIGGVKTLLLGSVLQAIALMFYIPFDGLASLYIVSLIFGLSQGGIVPSYALIVREYLPPHEAGERIGIVIMATIVGMALGGWLSGFIYDLTGSYRAAFLNGIAWNMLNIAVMAFLLMRTRAPKGKGGVVPA